MSASGASPEKSSTAQLLSVTIVHMIVALDFDNAASEHGEGNISNPNFGINPEIIALARSFTLLACL